MTTNPSPLQWAQWIFATLTAAITLGYTAVDKFETKESAKEHRQFIEQRLIRIETKLDKILESK